jgi:hypothetical protein
MAGKLAALEGVIASYDDLDASLARDIIDGPRSLTNKVYECFHFAALMSRVRPFMFCVCVCDD